MVFYFKSRDGKFREFNRSRKAKGLFSRPLDFGRNAPAGRRWGVQVADRPIPAGAVAYAK